MSDSRKEEFNSSEPLKARTVEPESLQDEAPLERELEDLPELKRFTTAKERRAALHQLSRQIENPYTVSYWIWVAALLCAAIGAARSVGWTLKLASIPRPFPAVVGIVAGIATYFLLSRMVIRRAVRSQLRREVDQAD